MGKVETTRAAAQEALAFYSTCAEALAYVRTIPGLSEDQVKPWVDACKAAGARAEHAWQEHADARAFEEQWNRVVPIGDDGTNIVHP